MYIWKINATVKQKLGVFFSKLGGTEPVSLLLWYAPKFLQLVLCYLKNVDRWLSIKWQLLKNIFVMTLFNLRNIGRWKPNKQQLFRVPSWSRYLLSSCNRGGWVSTNQKNGLAIKTCFLFCCFAPFGIAYILHLAIFSNVWNTVIHAVFFILVGLGGFIITTTTAIILAVLSWVQYFV